MLGDTVFQPVIAALIGLLPELCGICDSDTAIFKWSNFICIGYCGIVYRGRNWSGCFV